MSKQRPALNDYLPSLLKQSAFTTLLMVASIGLAQADPVLSIVLNTPSASGTSIGPIASGVDTDSYLYYSRGVDTVVETPRVVIKTPAGPGTTGLAWDYLDTTTSYTDTLSTRYYDNGYASVSADHSVPANFSSGKYIQLSGTISATKALSLHYSITADGNYQAITTPFGTAAPTLPAFYFSTGSSTLAPTAVTNSSDAGSYYSYFSNGLLTLAANSSISFTAVVYAGDGVSLQDFGVNFYSDYYKSDDTVTNHSSTDSRLVGAHLIPAQPVPEPSTYLMLLGGLLCIGNAASRRRRNPTFQ